MRLTLFFELIRNATKPATNAPRAWPSAMQINAAVGIAAIITGTSDIDRGFSPAGGGYMLAVIDSVSVTVNAPAITATTAAKMFRKRDGIVQYLQANVLYSEKSTGAISAGKVPVSW